MIWGLVAAPVDPLGLQSTEEAFDHRVIPAIALATHAALDAMGLEQLAKGLTGVLHAAVRMVDQLSLRRMAPPQRHLEGLTVQRAG